MQLDKWLVEDEAPLPSPITGLQNGFWNCISLAMSLPFRFVSFPLIGFAIALLLEPTAVSAIEVRISPDGPIHNLLEARDAVRKARASKPDEAAVIVVPTGVHLQTESVVLEAQDSNLTIQATEAGRPWLIGAPVVTDWQVHEGEIRKANVSSIVPKGLVVRQLLRNGERQPIAQYPNFDPDNPLYGGWAFIPPFQDDKAPAGHDSKSELYITAEDVRQWAHPEEVEINIFGGSGWWNFILPVQSLDPDSRKMTLQKPAAYDLRPGNRYRFQNALEELDAPGEWYYDAGTQDLYYFPPADGAADEIRIPTPDSFFQIKDARDITISGLGFVGCTETAITVRDSDNVRIEKCHLRNVGGAGGSGISITKGNACTVSRCEIEGAAYHGVSLVGGDRVTLTGPGHVVENCHIHNIGVIRKNGAGISMNGVNLIARHNHIHHIPRIGVQMSGNNCKVDWNYIHHSMLETSDGGAIYTGGRNWTDSRGTSWSHNLIHDTVGCTQEKGELLVPHFAFGLYPDDNSGGLDIIGNVVYNSGSSGIHMHNARDCVLEHNIFGSSERWTFDLHGWTTEMSYWTNHIETMIKGYEAVIDQSAWKNMRNMDLHPRDASRSDGTIMSGNRITHNIFYADKKSTLYASMKYCNPEWNTIDNNLAWNAAGPVHTIARDVGEDTGKDLLKGAAIFGKKADSVPRGWGWNNRPDGMAWEMDKDGYLVAGTGPTDKGNKRSTFHGPAIAAQHGKAYRVRAKIKGSNPDMKVDFAVASYKSKVGYWQGKTSTYTLGTEWLEVEAIATIPAPEDSDFKEWIDDCYAYFSCDTKGTITVSEMTIHEAATLSEWESWQRLGWDQHSITADPLFVDPAKGDYHLKPGSPAEKIGFQATPIEKIGIQPE